MTDFFVVLFALVFVPRSALFLPSLPWRNVSWLWFSGKPHPVAFLQRPCLLLSFAESDLKLSLPLHDGLSPPFCKQIILLPTSLSCTPKGQVPIFVCVPPSFLSIGDVGARPILVSPPISFFFFPFPTPLSSPPKKWVVFVDFPFDDTPQN